MWIVRQIAILKLPLLLAAGLAAFWLLDSTRRRRPSLLAGAVGACLGWGLALHLSTDVTMSQVLRANNLARTRALSDVIPDKSAIVAHWGNADAAAPMLFNRDIVVLDVAADDGRDASQLIRELLSRNRRVFVLEDGFSPEIRGRVLAGLNTRVGPHSILPILTVSSASP
jgi:hypothetical protein